MRWCRCFEFKGDGLGKYSYRLDHHVLGWEI
jgi:hypothetical protein